MKTSVFRNIVFAVAAIAWIGFFLTMTEQSTNALRDQPTTEEQELEKPELEIPGVSGDYLLFKINYVYRPGGKGPFKTLENGSVLRSGDHYKIIFTPSQDCYVYIFQVDGASMIYSLFPMERFGGIMVNNFNPVQAGKTYYLPAEKKSFVLDQQTGTEHLYFLTSRQRDMELEQQYQQAVEAQQKRQDLEKQLQQIDQLLKLAMETKGVANVVSDPAETESTTWEESGQTFSVLQQRLENMCDGCVHALQFIHE